MLTLVSSSKLYINPEKKKKEEKPMFGTVSSRPLIMYTADWVPAASFQTRPESAIHFLLHLGIPPLHCTQIPGAGVVPLDLRAKIYLNKRLHQVRSLLASV